MPQKPFCFTMLAAASTYQFLQMLHKQVEAPHAGFSATLHPQAPDNHGRHWRGFRASIKGEDGGHLYIHTGLVYHPDTRRGIYLEVDRKNNLPVYGTVWDRIQPSDEYDLCKDEPDYLKLFFPDSKLDALMGCGTSEEQAQRWRRYFEHCVEALLRAGKGGQA